tara:strand:- start:320 stop:502 length:183 start_codon:yes stop_codon:yes gene_type:complete
MKKITYYITISILLLICISCEDDPLLAPQTDTGGDGGSYGILILDEGDELDQNEINPEIF